MQYPLKSNASKVEQKGVQEETNAQQSRKQSEMNGTILIPASQKSETSWNPFCGWSNPMQSMCVSVAFGLRISFHVIVYFSDVMHHGHEGRVVQCEMNA